MRREYNEKEKRRGYNKNEERRDESSTACFY